MLEGALRCLSIILIVLGSYIVITERRNRKCLKRLERLKRLKYHLS